MRFLWIAVLGLVAPFAQAADPIGRIFFTTEQRAQLDNLRKQKAVASKVSDEPLPETVSYSGIVRRSDGKATVWLNNEPLSEADLRNKQSIVGSIGRDGRVTLQAPQAAVQLKVGQSATLFTGKVDESLTPKRTLPEKTKPLDSSAATQKGAASSKEVPPELLEALRQAVSRANNQAPAEIGKEIPEPAARP